MLSSLETLAGRIRSAWRDRTHVTQGRKGGNRSNLYTLRGFVRWLGERFKGGADIGVRHNYKSKDNYKRATREKSGYVFKWRWGGSGSPQNGDYGGKVQSLEKTQEALTAHPWRAMSRNDVNLALSAMPSQLCKAFMEEAKAKGEGSFMAEYFAAWKWSGGAKA